MGVPKLPEAKKAVSQNRLPEHGKTHANDNDFLDGIHLGLVGLRLVSERDRDGGTGERALGCSRGHGL